MRRAHRFGSCVAVALVAAAVWFGGAPPARAAAVPVVSLTFDDGLASQWVARTALRAHKFHGTFYVNSTHLDTAGRLTSAQVRRLAAEGHEIGGHTSDHVNLPTLDEAEQRRQVCDDRVALGRLLAPTRVKSFAYPYGAARPSVARVVRSCGYNSARIVGGLNPEAGDCAGCPYAEALEPANPYRIRSSTSFVADTPIAVAKAQVIGAERTGGGWVPLVFHEVCEGCSELSITPHDLDALLDWIAARRIPVRTVDEVIGGRARPAVAGPSGTPQEGRLVNPSLELPGSPDGQFTGLESSYCWRRAGFGTNVASWRRVRTGRSGSLAEEVRIRRRGTGDRKLITRTDTGSCSPAVREGHRYELGGWYRGQAAPRMIAYYQQKDGKWRYWSASPAAQPAAEWHQLRWTTPPAPRDAVRISFGMQTVDLGTLTIDDLSLRAVTERMPGVRVLLLGLVGVLFGVPIAGHALLRRVRVRRASDHFFSE